MQGCPIKKFLCYLVSDEPAPAIIAHILVRDGLQLRHHKNFLMGPPLLNNALLWTFVHICTIMKSSNDETIDMKTNINQLNDIPNEVIWKSLTTIVSRFDLKEIEARILMGDMPRSTYTSQKAKLNRDQKERVSYLLGIYKSLRILFDDEQQAITWINRPNTLPPFNGLTPKKYMLEGGIIRLSEVRKFLDFWRGY